jgi:tripartite-type tricarboxylate transporter receptor subunit TctC
MRSVRHGIATRSALAMTKKLSLRGSVPKQSRSIRIDVRHGVATRIALAMTIALLAASFAAGADALAQKYPSRPVRFISPSPPGGTVDLLTRAVGQKLSEQLGVPVIVDNRAGGSAVIGSELLVNSAPDGHTIMLGYSTHALNPMFIPKLPYDSVRDFASIAYVGYVPLLLVVHPSLPAANVPELIALAKAKPGALTFAAGAAGGGPSMAGQLFRYLAKIDIGQVQYKGNAPAQIDLLAGRVSMMFDTIGTSLPHGRSGKLRMLAVTSPTRTTLAPDVPTMVENGLAGFDVRAWFVVMAPAGTPRDLVTRLNNEVNAALKDPAFRSRVSALGVELVGGTPEQADAFVRSEMARWAKVVKAAGMMAN